MRRQHLHIEVPRYDVAEVARYLGIPRKTLSSWLAPDGLIMPAGQAEQRLSFENLVEAHVLKELRKIRDVPFRAVRQAVKYLESDLGRVRPLLSADLETAFGKVFVTHNGQLLDVSHSGQVAIEEVLRGHLKRVERDSSKRPIRLFPIVDALSDSSQQSIVIDPQVSFGKPTIAGKGILTSVIVQRINAGEAVESVSADYGIDEAIVRHAIVFAAAA